MHNYSSTRPVWGDEWPSFDQKKPSSLRAIRGSTSSSSKKALHPRSTPAARTQEARSSYPLIATRHFTLATPGQPRCCGQPGCRSIRLELCLPDSCGRRCGILTPRGSVNGAHTCHAIRHPRYRSDRRSSIIDRAGSFRPGRSRSSSNPQARPRWFASVAADCCC